MNIKLLITAAFLSILISCGKKGAVESGERQSITFDTLQFFERYRLVAGADNTEQQFSLSLLLPTKFRDEEVLVKMRQQFISSLFSEEYAKLPPAEAASRYIQAYMTGFETPYDSIIRISDNEEFKWTERWNYTSGVFIFFSNSDYLSYTVGTEQYTGGVHPGHSFANSVIDLSTGDLLHEQQLFVDGYREKLSALIAAELRKQYGEALEDMGFNDVKEIAPNDNFYLDVNGLTYTYNEYEIASYSVGVIDVTLSFESLKPLLRKPITITKR